MRRLPWLRFAALTILSVSALASTACASKTINNVLADPSHYRSREVTVTGTVVESFSLVERGAYMLDDRTGQLWVVSDRGNPRKGAQVKAKGTIREGFNLGSLGELIRVPGIESGLVLIESSRDARD
jgi:hypothetical protein